RLGAPRVASTWPTPERVPAAETVVAKLNNWPWRFMLTGPDNSTVPDKWPVMGTALPGPVRPFFDSACALSRPGWPAPNCSLASPMAVSDSPRAPTPNRILFISVALSLHGSWGVAAGPGVGTTPPWPAGHARPWNTICQRVHGMVIAWQLFSGLT